MFPRLRFSSNEDEQTFGCKKRKDRKFERSTKKLNAIIAKTCKYGKAIIDFDAEECCAPEPLVWYNNLKK